MHPTVMTMIAEDRALDLRSAATLRRRSRIARAGTRGGVFTLRRRPRRAARVVHA